jgi:hypothetical protein
MNRGELFVGTLPKVQLIRMLPEAPVCTCIVIGNDPQSDLGQRVLCKQEAVAVCSLVQDPQSSFYVCQEHLEALNVQAAERPTDQILESARSVKLE